MAGKVLHDTNADFNNSSLITCSSEQGDNYSVDLQRESQISIAWKNLRFEATKWGFQKKVILKRLNGYFEIGSLNGLLGPSGAGKTTLLNCLSGTFKLGLSEDSEVYLNSKHQSTVSFFIEQHVHESIVGQLTVKQILQYAFAFKNGVCHTGDVVDECIRQTLKDLFLDEHVLNQTFDSCSGGEQRRIAICQELMAIEKPSFLFVDEPTTGLDSASAAEVVKCLQKLSNIYQITVIASIHCPNSETLGFFDKLYILAKGGVCIFSGPPNRIQESLDQVQYETSSEQPPVEALVSIACNGTNDPIVTKLADQVLAEEHHSISLHQPSLTLQPNGLHVRQKGFSPVDFVLQCFRLSRITFIAKRKTLFISFSLLVIYFGLMASLFSPTMTTASACFSKDENSNMTSCTGNVQEDVKIRENICFLTFVILYTGMIIVCSSAILFSSFVKVFKSEHRNYWYSLGSFFWSSLLISFIEVSLYALFNACLGYFLPAQHAIDNYTINWSRFGLYFLFMWLLSLYMQSFGQLIGIILVNHMEFAIIACMIFNASLTLMNGLFVDMSRNENALILAASNVVANKYISYGILYTFYGFQRCDWENEYSIIIQFFAMDLNGVQHWIRRIVVNVLIIKLFTLAVMYYKFGNFSGNLLFRLFKKCNDEHVLQSDLISIDYDESVSIDGLNTNNKKEANEKSSNEVQFDEFSRGRIMIAWRNLTLFGSSTIHEIGSSTMPRRPILRNLNGQFRFGTLNAIMGTSGAGKTSLLKVLNGRCKTRLGADTAFYLTQFTKIHTCFITQEVSNHLMPGLTAKQMLIFASRMKNTRTDVDHERIALKWLNELDLLNTMDTKVENCSGGERKRLAVALELTSIEMGPNLICLDECTSGLDSNSSRIVISTLHKLAQSHPLTIITSIHQPTAEVLFMFDSLYILARGGVCLYSGAPYDVKPYMNQLSGIIETDSKYAIETLIKHSCSNHHNPIVRKLVRHNDSQLLQVKTSELLDDTQLVLDGVQKNRHRFSLRSSFILFMRYFAYFRGHQWIESIFFAFNFFFYGFALRFFYEKKMIYITGCLNIQEDDTSACRRTPENVEELYQLLNNFKFNFFYANFFLFFIVFQCSMSFLKELKYFKNEHRNGWYSSGSLYLMKSLVDILPLIPVIMFYVYICNWYEEIRPGIFWNFVFVFLLGAVAFQGMGHVFAICSNGNITVLIVLSTTVFFFFTLLSNFLLTYSRLHYIYQFISNLAISKFIFEAVMLLIYGFERCKSNEIQQLLYTMTISDADYNHCIIMLIFNIIFYRVLTIYLLIWKANPVENRRQRMARIVDYMGNLEPARTLIPGLSASQLDLSVKVPNV